MNKYLKNIKEIKCFFKKQFSVYKLEENNSLKFSL